MAEEISRKTPIGELVLNHPVAASVLLEHGFHCIGCGLAAYETIEEGAAAHGFDDASIDALVEKMKDAVKNEEKMLAQAVAGAKEAKKPAAKEEKTKKQASKKSKSG